MPSLYVRPPVCEVGNRAMYYICGMPSVWGGEHRHVGPQCVRWGTESCTIYVRPQYVRWRTESCTNYVGSPVCEVGNRVMYYIYGKPSV